MVLLPLIRFLDTAGGDDFCGEFSFSLSSTSGGDPLKKKGIQESINKRVVGQNNRVTGWYIVLWNVNKTSMQVYLDCKKCDVQFAVSVPISR